MAWEKRRGKPPVYTRSKRVGGKIVREYIGRGEEAERIAEEDQRAREAAAQERAEQKQRREQWAREDALVAAACAQIEEAARDVFKQAGYWRHARGEWRKKRGNEEEGNAAV